MSKKPNPSHRLPWLRDPEQVVDMAQIVFESEKTKAY